MVDILENILETIQRLVGPIKKQQMKFVDSFVTKKVAMFTPVVGQCYYAIESHSHPAYSFVIAFDCNAKIEIDGKILSLEHSKIYAFSPGVVHREIASKEFSRYVAIMIDKDFFESELKLYDCNQMVLRCDGFVNSSDISNSLKDFMFEYEQKMPGYEKLLDAFGLKITHSIIREICNVKPRIEKVTSSMKINKAIEYMHLNYSRKIKVEMLADISAMSTSHFARIFKEETALSPVDYLTKVRLKKATKLLTIKEKSLTEIAFECGFNSSSYFSTCFQKHYLKSPSEFRTV